MAKQRIKHLSAQELATKDMVSLKKQYVKQSYVARKRYESLQKSFPGSEIVQRRKGAFQPLRNLKGISRSDLAKELSDVTRFLASSSSRATEYANVRAETIKTFHRHGYEDVTESNLDPLIQFLEDARQRHLATIYGSEQLIEVFNRAQKRGLSREQLLGNIEYWAEHDDKQPRLYASRYSSVKEFYGNNN